MRRFVVALVAALLALSLAGCGGEGGEATTEAPPAAAAPSEAAPPAAAEYVTDRSANDSGDPPAAFPSFVNTSTPAVFQEKLDAGRPMLILFQDERQQVTGTFRAEVDAVMEKYRGLIDLLVFNLAGDSMDPDVLASVTYAGELGVNSSPYVIVVDENGFIIWRNKGFAERGIIEREVERATR
ncbi:MAG: hypothetical protein ACYCXZ_08110 [Coriobacteriia bacterium]